MQDYWLRQDKAKPLYPDLIWSQPQNRTQAGKLLVVGGNAHGFAAAALAYNQSIKAGIGSARVVLPDALKASVGQVLLSGEYAPSTPSGSFGKLALAELLSMANWSDGVLLAGDLGRNSETAVMLEQFATKYDGQLTITKDAVDYFMASPAAVIDRQGTLLVVSFAQLQKVFTASGSTTALTFDMDLLRLVETLHEFSTNHSCGLIVKHLNNIIVVARGKVSTTKLDKDINVWRVTYAAQASVWWLQNPDQAFESLTSAVATIKTQT